jgi:hypothetical protein
MNFEKFKRCFHESWHDKIRPFIESEECDNIYKFLKHESGRGKRIAPLSDNVYRCFLETPLDTLKVVMHCLWAVLPLVMHNHLYSSFMML